MPGCRTRWWRCATARWAGSSLAFPATAGKPGASPTSPRAGLAGRDPQPAVLGLAPRRELELQPAELEALLRREAATVIDLSLSRAYRRAHVPGAWFTIRSRLERALSVIPLRGTLVFTSEEGILAGLA